MHGDVRSGARSGDQPLRAYWWMMTQNLIAAVGLDPETLFSKSAFRGNDAARNSLSGLVEALHRYTEARAALRLDALIEELVERGRRIDLAAPPPRLPSPMLHGFGAMPLRIVAEA